MATEVEYSDAFLQDFGEDLLGLFSDDLLTDGLINDLSSAASVNIVSEASSLQTCDRSVLDSEASIAQDDASMQSLVSVNKSKRKPKIKLEDADIDLSDEPRHKPGHHMSSSTNTKLPRLAHSSLNDVRRHYARMFANCVNSSDLQNVDSYFNTFMAGPCTIEANHRITSSYGLPQRMVAVGPRLFAHYLLGCFVTFPDLMIKLNDSRIVTSRHWRGSKIVMEIEAHCTKIYDIPDYQWVPGGVDELSELYAGMNVKEGHSGGSERENCNGSVSGSGSGSGGGGQHSPYSASPYSQNYSAPSYAIHTTHTTYPTLPVQYTHPTAQHTPHSAPHTAPQSTYAMSTLHTPPLSAIPQSFVERVVQRATLVATPVPLVTKGVFTLYLDENHCMTRVVIDHWQQDPTAMPRRPTFG